MIQSRRDVRVVLHLWMNSDVFIAARPPTERSLLALRGLAGKFRAGHLHSLSELYFFRYDGLRYFNHLGQVIIDGLARAEARKLASELRRQKEYADQLFGPDAPRRIAQAVHGGAKDLSSLLKQYGVPIQKEGRFVQACKNAYFIETIRTVPIGDPSPVFKEIVRPEVKESPYKEGFNIGQMVAGIMIDRCDGEPAGMPQNWLDIVLHIMGDPRRPRSSQPFQKWWVVMPDQHISAMKRWLAGFDLKLFLQILKDSSTDPALARMYPPREAFLEGLLKNYEVKDARLFLGEEPARFIRKNYGPEAVKNHGRLHDRHKTIIYMNVNGLHFFEGTHNCAARLGAVLPDDHPVVSRSQASFGYYALTSGIERDMDRAGKEALQRNRVVSVVHSPTTWQHNLISGFKQLGLDISPEHVLSKEDYRWYRRRYGI